MGGERAGVVQTSGLEDGRGGSKGVLRSGVGAEEGRHGGNGVAGKGVGDVGDAAGGTWGEEVVVEDSFVNSILVLQVLLMSVPRALDGGWGVQVSRLGGVCAVPSRGYRQVAEGGNEGSNF